jgi:hypothetical protein
MKGTCAILLSERARYDAQGRQRQTGKFPNMLDAGPAK